MSEYRKNASGNLNLAFFSESNRIEKILRTEVVNRIDKLDNDQQHIAKNLKVEKKEQRSSIEKQFSQIF